MPQFNLKIAGLVASVTARCDSTPYYMERYLTEEPAAVEIVVTQSALDLERQLRHAEALAEGIKPRRDQDPLLERLAILRQFSRLALDRDILPVHGSAVALDGVGYLFTAPCGVGKSTHTRLWREVFGNRVVMINDDKPFIRATPRGITLCGSPWSGKHGIDTNLEVPLGGICLLSRSLENGICPADAADRAQICRTIQPFLESDLIESYQQLAAEVTDRVPTWHLGCNMEAVAARVSGRAMHESAATPYTEERRGSDGM